MDEPPPREGRGPRSPGHLGAVIGRGIVDDEDPYVHALLVIKDAGDGLHKMAVVVAGDDNTD